MSWCSWLMFYNWICKELMCTNAPCISALCSDINFMVNEVCKYLTRSYLCGWCWLNEEPRLLPHACGQETFTFSQHRPTHMLHDHSQKCTLQNAERVLLLAAGRWMVLRSGVTRLVPAAAQGAEGLFLPPVLHCAASQFAFISFGSWCLCCASQVCAVFCFVLVSAGMELFFPVCQVRILGGKQCW